MGFLSRLFGRGSRAIQLKPGRGWTLRVVGTSHYQADLAAIYRRNGGNGSDLKIDAELDREPQNKRDKNAVVVKIDGRPVGYLQAEDAELYASAALPSPGKCSAKIVGGYFEDDGEQANFGVRLNLSLPPKRAGQ